MKIVISMFRIGDIVNSGNYVEIFLRGIFNDSGQSSYYGTDRKKRKTLDFLLERDYLSDNEKWQYKAG